MEMALKKNNEIGEANWVVFDGSEGTHIEFLGHLESKTIPLLEKKKDTTSYCV
jgi:hypothetical protein